MDRIYINRSEEWMRAQSQKLKFLDKFKTTRTLLLGGLNKVLEMEND
jgi:hypothetical protein